MRYLRIAVVRYSGGKKDREQLFNMEEQKECVRHILVVGVKNNKASEVMEHYRVVTETQGQSAPPS